MAIVIVLRAVIRIHSDDVERARDATFIDDRAGWASQVVSDELIGPFVFADKLGLPGEEIGGLPL